MITVTENNIQSTFCAKPDASINFKMVYKHFKQFPERWNSTFRFLIENDLSKLPLGRIDLNEDVYVTVSEYTTKNPENALYESHKKYIDLQYIVSGNEYIGLTNNTTIPVTSPYNEQKDIAFYTFNGGELLLATPTVYFIFFPKIYTVHA
jgi:YhcH/YjgK/YiaL family protein